MELSVEFFPPKTAEGSAKLRSVREQLAAALKPTFFSVTFGAGGSTQDGTLATVKEIHEAGQQAAASDVLHEVPPSVVRCRAPYGTGRRSANVCRPVTPAAAGGRGPRRHRAPQGSGGRRTWRRDRGLRDRGDRSLAFQR